MKRIKIAIHNLGKERQKAILWNPYCLVPLVMGQDITIRLVGDEPYGNNEEYEKLGWGYAMGYHDVPSYANFLKRVALGYMINNIEILNHQNITDFREWLSDGATFKEPGVDFNYILKHCPNGKLLSVVSKIYWGVAWEIEVKPKSETVFSFTELERTLPTL